MSVASSDEKDDGALIIPYRDGPLLVRGRFRIVDQSGQTIEALAGTAALCRCGHSDIRPFCDGTHRRVGFRASGAAEEPAGPAAESDDPCR
jgi:CDGSH-type Zn-finger protein